MSFKKSGSTSDKQFRKFSAIHILKNREIYGIACHQKRRNPGGTPSRIFSTLPNRLVFSLKDIVSIEKLVEEAHVFLGFNSDGTLLISYTEVFEAEENTGFPSYVYYLHWWLFDFHRSMKKLASVRLFANEKVSSPLKLTYAEWPKTKSKIIFYGWENDLENCYITVAAVPSLLNCLNCSFVITDSQISSPEKCLEHGFSVHMKHTSVSSHTIILNSRGLRIDNLIILNMGHSIAVMSLGILKKGASTDCLPLSLFKKANSRKEKFSSTTSESNSMTDSTKYSSQSSESYNSQKLSQCSVEDFSERTKSETDADVCSFPQNSQDSQISINNKNTLVSPHHPPEKTHCACNKQMPPPSSDFRTTNSAKSSQEDPYFDYYSEPKSIVLRQPFSQIDASKYHNENVCIGVHSSNRSMQLNKECFSAASVSSANRSRLGITRKRYNTQNVENDCDKMPLSPVQDCSITFKSSESTEVLCTYCGLKIDNKSLCLPTVKFSEDKKSKNYLSQKHNSFASCNFLKNRKLLLSEIKEAHEPWQHSLDLNAPTPSPSTSESSFGEVGSSSVIKSGRQGEGISFIETLYEQTLDVRADNEFNAALSSDENGLFYGPVTFQGDAGVPLIPCQSNNTLDAAAFSQDLVLDIEHVIFDVLLTRSYVTYKLGMLIDYDVQIVNTCPATHSVTMFVVALLDISAKRKREDNHQSSPKPSVSKNNFHEVQFFLCWRLQTGRYEVVAWHLRPYSEKVSGKWDASWTREVCTKVRHVDAIPQSRHSSVYSLNNSNVISGRSLNLLWDPDQMYVIRK